MLHEVYTNAMPILYAKSMRYEICHDQVQIKWHLRRLLFHKLDWWPCRMCHGLLCALNGAQISLVIALARIFD